MIHAILSRPDVSFRYINQGKTIYRSPGDGSLESAGYCIFGNEMLRKTTKPVEGHQNGIVVHGFVGVGESGRGNRSSEYFFINGRYLESSLLSSAVEEGTRERVMIGHFPMFILHLTMPYDSVDVNVHPNKLQVRFRKEAEVQSAVAQLVKDALTDPDVFSQPETIVLTEEPSMLEVEVRSYPVVPPTDAAKPVSAAPKFESVQNGEIHDNAPEAPAVGNLIVTFS